MKTAAVYIASTDEGDFLFDESLTLLPGENIETLESPIVITFQQEALASTEAWQEWFTDYDEKTLVLKIQELIEQKMKHLARNLELRNKH